MYHAGRKTSAQAPISVGQGGRANRGSRRLYWVWEPVNQAWRIAMFFIGIFGVQSKMKTLRTEAGVICPLCETYDRFDVIQVYDYFHIFFIPLWKWNKRYFIQTRCCRSRCALDSELGARIEAGELVKITREHIDCTGPQGAATLCPHCRQALHPSFHYCPHCGTQL
ncbi:MAG: zinc ribbon domain-containing protein [Limnochordia bacterium]